MANWLRLRRQAHTPREWDGTETIFAAADGTLKHMDPDGTVTNVTGEGSLPSPTSEGDVLTVVEGEWAGEAPSGGSQPIIEVSFPFAFDTPGLLNGVTVHTPEVDDILLDAWFEGDPADLFDGPEAFPLAEIGRISEGAWVTGENWFGVAGGAPALDSLDARDTGMSKYAVNNSGATPSLSGWMAANAAATTTSFALPQRRLTTADPIMLVVSGDSLPGGTDPESTQGSCVLRMIFLRPS